MKTTHTSLWRSGILLTILALAMSGCGSSNWSPTDPRLDEPDMSNVQILDTWEASVQTEVQ
ncbi:hypothetical protein JW933_04080 [candidate division FCPU426 bacterium]|nr:hypothetical protein [candidate division FCPU426 bacterium]